MAREIVNNLKFKKITGNFDPNEFAKLFDEAYISTRRPEGKITKTTFSPSSFGYGQGTCARYWYLAFSGAVFSEQQDAQALANMQQGTQAHERIQGIIKKMGVLKHEELEITNEYPPIRGFIDLIIDWKGQEVVGEIKTAKQESWDTYQSKMSPSANHLLQLLSYMKLRDAKEGFLMYENKNTQQVLVIPINMNERNKKIINDLFIWLGEVYDNFKEGGLPMRIFTKSSSACKYCPIKKECWGMPEGTVQIDPYEVPKL